MFLNKSSLEGEMDDTKPESDDIFWSSDEAVKEGLGILNHGDDPSCKAGGG